MANRFGIRGQWPQANQEQSRRTGAGRLGQPAQHEKLGLSYLFIAHDLAVVRSIATDVAVMYAGALVEQAPKMTLYATPKHPYTQALLEAVPRPDPNRARSAPLGGEVPSILNPPPGCAFAARCPRAMDVCRSEPPAPRAAGEGHVVACHLY